MTRHLLHASCKLTFNAQIPTPMILMLRPRSGPNQWVTREDYRLTPLVQVEEVTDGFGNLCQRLVAPAGEFEIYTSADVIVEDESQVAEDAFFVEIPRLPSAVLVYLLPSRYCESDRFGDMASEIVLQANAGYDQVAAITEWVRANIRNVPISSTYPVSAVEVNQRREGVCRDLAQMSIALCRALCIPARLVVGYLHGLVPMDLHAWFEAYVGDRWYAFDPSIPPDGGPRIAIAHGRDSTDVAIYNQYVTLVLPDAMTVSVQKWKFT
ncbi:MAG: transglutaminase family protein [Burkholderiaceae bacterium]